MTPDATAHLAEQHEIMLRAVQRMRIALLSGDVFAARAALEMLQVLHSHHAAVEDSELIPKLGAAARWGAKIYLAEHAKLTAMIAQWCDRLAPLPDSLSDAQSRLTLVDASLPLQHLLEHHFEREDKGLFIEAGNG